MHFLPIKVVTDLTSLQTSRVFSSNTFLVTNNDTSPIGCPEFLGGYQTFQWLRWKCLNLLQANVKNMIRTFVEIIHFKEQNKNLFIRDKKLLKI